MRMSVILLTAIGWIAGVVFVLFLIAFFDRINRKGEVDKRAKTYFAIWVVGAVALIAALVLYFNATAVGQQIVQRWNAQSEGIYREIEVYSMTGELISSYSGICNIEYDDNRVEIYDVEKDKRIIVYYKNGTIIVSE